MPADYGWLIKREKENGKGKRVKWVRRSIKEKKKKFCGLKMEHRS
jgi:hypothetical protein